MSNHIYLDGLSVTDFIHPKEIEKKRHLESKMTEKIFDTLNNLCQSIMQPIVDGVYVQVSNDAMPHLYQILGEVCHILDYKNPIPQICISHRFSDSIAPCGNETYTYLLVPERIVQDFDDDMLYYSFGNAITMLKAGHMRYANMAGFVPSVGVFDIIKKPFIDFLHAADATSDRGGLLACQSFAAAVRCHLYELGMPVSSSKKLFQNDTQAKNFVRNYLQSFISIKNDTSSIETKVARMWQDITYIEGAGNLMLYELYDWYIALDGYSSILKRYTKK